MAKEKSLESLLKQDLKKVMKKGGLPDKIIEAEQDLENKTLVGSLKIWAKEPKSQEILENMMVTDITTRALGNDVAVVSIYLGSVRGVLAIEKVKERDGLPGFEKPFGGQNGHA